MLMTLTLSVCHAWGNPMLTLCLAGLTALIARDSVSPLCALGKLSFQKKRKKKKKKSFLLWAGRKQLGRGFEQPVTSELTSAQCPHVSPSLQREHSSVLFTQHDQRSSAAASNMISFCESDGEIDDSLSLVALVPRTPAQVRPGTGTSEVLLISQAERGGA